METMKKIKIKASLILVLLVTIFALTSVIPIFAIGTEFTMKASKMTIERGEKVTITVATNNIADVNGGFNGYNGVLSSDPAYLSLNTQTSLVPAWDFIYQDKANTFVGYDTTDNDYKVKDLNLLAFEFTVLDKAPLGTTKINLSKIAISAKGYINHNLPDASITLTIVDKTTPAEPSKSSNSLLSGISIKDGSGNNIILSPKFSSNINNYTATVKTDQNQIDLSGTLSDSKSTIISGSGKHNLVNGDNKVDVIVRAEDGSETKYTVNINKPAADTGQGDTDVIDKDADDNRTDDVGKDDGNSSIDVNINNTNTNTNTNDNINSNKNERLNTTSSNNYIINIQGLGNLDKDFNKEVTDYRAVVGRETKDLNLSVLLDDPNSTYTIKGDKDLKIGKNYVIIEVEAPNGDIREYRIEVERTEEESSALLSTMSVGGYAINPGFVENQMFYNLVVPSEVTTLGVSATPKYGGTSINVAGNQTIKPGLNYVKVAVSANGQMNTYVVEVIREQPAPVINYLPWIIAGFGIFTTIILLVILIIQGRKTVVYSPPYTQENR